MSAEKTYTLTMDQVDKINEHLGDVGAMLGCLTAGGAVLQSLTWAPMPNSWKKNLMIW